VVLADVKVVPRARLTPAQERIKEAVEAGRVGWKIIHLGGGEVEDP
jgi:predicted Holliday junction resolvase-like endonuclease